MKDAGVGLKRLLGHDIARNHGLGAQRHRDDGRGWAEESGQRCDGIRKTSYLAPKFQGDDL